MEASVRSWLADLPNELLLEILDLLDRFQLNKLVRVNKHVRSLSQYILEHRKKIRLCGDHLRVLPLAIPSKYDAVEIPQADSVIPTSISRAEILTNVFMNEAPMTQCRGFYQFKSREQMLSRSMSNGGKIRTITFIEPPMANRYRIKLYTVATTADLCLLIVDPEEIDMYSEDIKELIFGCCFMMSARNVIVAIDLSNVNANESIALHAVFNQAKIKMSKLLDRTVGMCYTITPINLRTGTNITSNITPKYEWFSGASLKKLVLDDQLRTNFEETAYNALCKAPLKLQLTNAYKISGIGTVLEGRILSGTMQQHYEQVVIHPNKTTTETRGLESCREPLKEAGPGSVVGVSVTMVPIREVWPQYSYVVRRKEAPTVNCTIAFRAQVAILKPDQIALHHVYTVFYGSSRIPCILWWIFPGKDGKYRSRSDRQCKGKTDLPDKPSGDYGSTRALIKAWRTYKGYLETVAMENKKIMLEGRSKFERPAKTKLDKKVTAILLPLIHYDIETYKTTEFEKNYTGKLMIVENRKIVGVGRVDRVISNSAETFTIPKNKDYQRQYAEVIDKAGSLFSLPKEQNLLQMFLNHVTNDEHAKKCIQKYKLVSAWLERYHRNYYS